MKDLVECYSGFEYSQRPIAFWWEGKRILITKIITEWLAPDEHCFRVQTQENLPFELFYGNHNNEWRIMPL
jgi:hypothetical protein